MTSRRGVYDNWGKLVEATLKRELFRELALSSSFNSSSSFYSSLDDDSCSTFDDSPFHVNNEFVESSSSSAQGEVVDSRSSTIPNNAGRFTARLLAALAQYIRGKEPQKTLFDFPSEVDLGHFKRFSLRELQVASDNFNNKNIIGRRSFGKVYKGCLADGSLVAVKRLKIKRTQGWELEFQAEVKIASIAVHPNLLGLLGICISPTERMLVYPYMFNGNVATILRERSESQPPLDWSKRKPIAVGSAKGLAYLHDQCDPKFIHRDVKAANISLNEDFEAVVGGFGLTIFMITRMLMLQQLYEEHLVI